jgi:hypothetical protein
VRREWFSHGGSKFDRFDTGLTPLVLTLVLSHLLALALGFELQVEGPENIWLISGVVLRPHTPVVTWRYITFRDGGQG